MRVIAGKFRKMKLFTDIGKTTRPTTDYIKELIFSVLFDCEGENVLDIYAGSGSLGFEALSREAKKITFVDASHRAISVIKRNVEKIGCSKDVNIVKKDVFRFLNSNIDKYSLVLMDPPYDKKLVNKTISLLLNSKSLEAQWRIVVEHSTKEKISSEFNEYILFTKDCGITSITVLSSDVSSEEGEINEDL